MQHTVKLKYSFPSAVTPVISLKFNNLGLERLILLFSKSEFLLQLFLGDFYELLNYYSWFDFTVFDIVPVQIDPNVFNAASYLTF